MEHDSKCERIHVAQALARGRLNLTSEEFKKLVAEQLPGKCACWCWERKNVGPFTGSNKFLKERTSQYILIARASKVKLEELEELGKSRSGRLGEELKPEDGADGGKVIEVDFRNRKKLK